MAKHEQSVDRPVVTLVTNDFNLAFPFLQNKGAFEEYLGPQQTWSDYEVRSYLVTKSPPIMSRYENTEILRASKFLDSVGGLQG